MKYVSIDLETTGLDVDHCDIIEFGAVLEDTELASSLFLSQLPTFHRYILPPTGVGFYRGEPSALSMHAEIFKRIGIAGGESGDGYEIIGGEYLGTSFLDWLHYHGVIKYRHDPITVAGKNFPSFDLQFLRRLPDFTPPVRFNHRYLDPAMLFWKPLEDSRVPNLATCLERAGIEKPVLHTAVDDALLVIELLRTSYNKEEYDG